MLKFHPWNIRKIDSDILFVRRHAMICINAYTSKNGIGATKTHFGVSEPIITGCDKGRLPSYQRAKAIIMVDIDDERIAHE